MRDGSKKKILKKILINLKGSVHVSFPADFRRHKLASENKTQLRSRKPEKYKLPVNEFEGT
jgi:hypothetical protein